MRRQPRPSRISGCCEVRHRRWLRGVAVLLKDLLRAPGDGRPAGPPQVRPSPGALTMLGQLPTRPETCPFCLQYGSDPSCRGCGYALSHSRCDSDASAFSLFIEAFQELGKAIYQDVEGPQPDPLEARKLLRASFLPLPKGRKRCWQTSFRPRLSISLS